MIRDLQIEPQLSYYTDSFNFEENFKILRYSGYRETSISLYIDYGNLSSEYDVEQDCIIEDTRENRVKIQRHLTKEGWRRVSEVEGTLDDLIDDIGNVDYSNIEELEEVLDELGISYTSNYVRMSTSGYSQGDYADILVNAKEFEKQSGCEFKPEPYQKWFDHYFWDSTIGGTIEVSFQYTRNGVNIDVEEELDFNDWTKDEYEVDLEVERMIDYLYLPYPLSDDEKVELINALGKIDYTDVKYPCS
jgi:hypothetical protein